MRFLLRLSLIGLLIGLGSLHAQQIAKLPVPTLPQQRFHEAELGVVFHYDLHVFDGQAYNQQQNRISPILDLNVFHPTELDTDQWIRTAKAAGAKFAILTATHETGFALYQSDVNPYCMKALKFQDGKGDIVRDFVNSCRKYDVLPGIYVGIRWNSFLGVHNFRIEGESQFVKNRQKAYQRMCEGMVKELCTRYGDLFLIWFDGGAADPRTYGPDVLPIVEQYQPDCLFYHNAQRADFRWGGSESGTVPYPCWATFPYPYSHSDNQQAIYADGFSLLKHGDKDGAYWVPAMSDAPLRGYNGRHEWFWEPGDEDAVYPVDHLMKMYYQSTGHNSTLILGLTPDPRGLMPEVDAQRLAAFGAEIRRRFSSPEGTTQGPGRELLLELDSRASINQVVIQEAIAQGERVRHYVIEARAGGRWREMARGSCIGHKRIHQFEAITTRRLRLRVLEARAQPQIKAFSAYAVDGRK